MALQAFVSHRYHHIFIQLNLWSRALTDEYTVACSVKMPTFYESLKFPYCVYKTLPPGPLNVPEKCSPQPLTRFLQNLLSFPGFQVKYLCTFLISLTLADTYLLSVTLFKKICPSPESCLKLFEDYPFSAVRTACLLYSQLPSTCGGLHH
jgi:hypothetical protein